jgi:hypothetical protein
VEQPITREGMKLLIDEITETKFQLDRFYEDKPDRAIPGPPASDRDLRDLEAHLRRRHLPFPPSYRLLLSVYDGVRSPFDDPGLSLLSARGVIQGEYSVDPQDFPTLSRFVIAAGNTPEFISFDPERAGPTGEMQVVHINSEGLEVRGDDLVQFLRDYLEYLQNALRLNRADREKLSDD